MKVIRTTLMVAAAAIGLLAAAAGPAASTPIDSAPVTPTTTAASAVPPKATAGVIVPNTIHYETKQYNGTLSRSVVATVACPAGMFVVSAGVQHGIITSLAPLRASNTPQNVANFTSVGARIWLALDDGVPGGTTFTSITAGCVPASQLAGGVSTSLMIDANSRDTHRSGTAQCPTGMRAFGGGAHYVTTNGSFSSYTSVTTANTISGDGQGWFYQGETYSPTDRLIITTQCLPLTGSYIFRTHQPAWPHGDVLAMCKSGSFAALSGGWYDGKVSYSMSSIDYWYGTPAFTDQPTISVLCVPGNPWESAAGGTAPAATPRQTR